MRFFNILSTAVLVFTAATSTAAQACPVNLDFTKRTSPVTNRCGCVTRMQARFC